MSDTATRTAEEAIERLSCHDFILKHIFLNDKRYTDAEIAELGDCLFAHPNAVTNLLLDENWLTDKTGVKLARYVAASSTIQILDLSFNQFGSATYLALAAALRTNTSLRYLYLFGNQAEDKSRINTAFVDALRLNPSRPADSDWCLYSFQYDVVDFERLQAAAEQQGHPSLQMILNNQLETTSIRSIRI